MKYQPSYFGTVSLVSYLFLSTINLTGILKSITPQTFPFHCNLPLGTPSSPAFCADVNVNSLVKRLVFFHVHHQLRARFDNQPPFGNMSPRKPPSEPTGEERRPAEIEPHDITFFL